MRNNTYYSLNDKLDFGKHSNQLLKDVLSNDPQYIHWCLIRINWFFLCDSAITYLENCEMTFTKGKYKGEKLDSVAKKDKSYIWWCIDQYDILLSQKVINQLQYSLETTFKYGYYMGFNLKTLIEWDVDYVLHLIEKDRYFCINEEAMTFMTEKSNVDENIVNINNEKIEHLNEKSIDNAQNKKEIDDEYEERIDMLDYRDFDDYSQPLYTDDVLDEFLAETFNYDPSLMWNID